MTVILRLVLFSFFLFPLVCVAQNGSRSEKAKVLELCQQYFGPPLDSRLNLYDANSFYVLHAGFDKENRLELLEVVPRYDFEDAHPEWRESSEFEYLSWTQYQNLLTRVELIKPRGQLLIPPPAITFVTNRTAWQTSIFKNAVFTMGILVDLDEPDDAPARLKWFKLEFGKEAFERERKARTGRLPDFSIETIEPKDFKGDQ